MDIQQIENMHNQLYNWGNRSDWAIAQICGNDIQMIKNELTLISQNIEKEYPFFSARLFYLKDCLFIEYGHFNPVIFGRIHEILKSLLDDYYSNRKNIWNHIHPQIAAVSKQLYLDGHYSNASCDAFIEVNDRVKKIFHILQPNEKVPDGDSAMKMVFSANSPIVELCDRSTDSGQNTQKGYMEMLSGAMSALRNPKAHANITITADDAMRRLMFASLLMYKIDEAVKYSKIKEE
ncbi:MAG: TIGR02391 family protein [Oscillospiraceae bacterium]